jgi:Ca2+-binding RTX toxin-like protein
VSATVVRYDFRIDVGSALTVNGPLAIDLQGNLSSPQIDIFGRLTSFNTDSVTGIGVANNGLYWELLHIHETGEVRVTSQFGDAIGMDGTITPYFYNEGLFRVEGLTSAVGANMSNLRRGPHNLGDIIVISQGQSVGFNIDGDRVVRNEGRIEVTGYESTAFKINGSEIIFENTGNIIARDNNDEKRSIGIEYTTDLNRGGPPVGVIDPLMSNHGWIEADIAILVGDPYYRPGTYYNYGTIVGDIILGNKDDLIINSTVYDVSDGVRAGHIFGNVFLGGGNDSYSARDGGKILNGAVYGELGNDGISLFGGNQSAFGGEGNDRLSVRGGGYLRGDEGDDRLSGGDMFDDLHGNMGNDTISGGAGGDWVVGGKDDDLLYGGHGLDAFSQGADGNDIVYGNLGNDTCYGEDGDDLIRGGQQNDVLYGGAGDDWLSGDRDNDTISGGSGADIFHTFGDAGIDRVLDFSRAEGDRVQLDPGTTYSVAQVGADTVISMGGGAQMTLVGVSMATLTDGWIFI